jgi:hypothetical protein
MDYDVERKYFIEKVLDFVQGLEEEAADLHQAEENRVLFRVNGRPFEVLAWINEDSDMLCITTRTDDLPIARFEEAVEFLKANLEVCWDYCVAVAPVDARYDLSMAMFVGGFTFEAFESAIYNLLGCAEAIEKNYEKRFEQGEEGEGEEKDKDKEKDKEKGKDKEK